MSVVLRFKRFNRHN